MAPRSSAETLRKFYQDFLRWGLADVEHVFFFTARDSEVFGVPEENETMLKV